MSKTICDVKILNNQRYFYRYHVGDAVVWFSQKSNGEIYSVGISLPDSFKGFELTVQGDFARNVYYPQNINITVHKELLSKDVDDYKTELTVVQQLCDDILNVFQMPVHKELYDKHHRKDVAINENS